MSSNGKDVLYDVETQPSGSDERATPPSSSGSAGGGAAAAEAETGPRKASPTSPSTGGSSGEQPPSYTSSTAMLPELGPHQTAYHAQQKEALHRTTFELDGRPLPDIDHEYYDEYHEPEPEHEHSHHLKDCYKSGENFRAFILHNHYLHIFIAILIVIDIIIVLAELIFDLEIAGKNECAHTHDCPRINVYGGNQTYNCSYDHHLTACIYKAGKRRCADEHDHHDLDPAEVLHYMSIAVLSCFVLETFIRFLALGREFFKRKLEVFDAIVVTLAFSLDVSVGHDAAVALLMLVRLWRITRIVNGIAIAVETREATKREHLRKQTRNARHELVRKKETVHLLRIELMEWKKAAAVMYSSEHAAAAAAASAPSEPATIDVSEQQACKMTFLP